MSTTQYIQADAVATRLKEDLDEIEGFRNTSVECIRALSIYKVVVRCNQGFKENFLKVVKKSINNVDVEVIDGTEEPSMY